MQEKLIFAVSNKSLIEDNELLWKKESEKYCMYCVQVPHILWLHYLLFELLT